MSEKNHHSHHHHNAHHSADHHGHGHGSDHNHNNNHHHHHKKKKKFTLFYKINFFAALFISLILLYFIILVSAEPKSFPYVTQKIKDYLHENFSDDVEMENSYISFTPYGSFKITVANLKINKSHPDNKKTEFEIPQIEAEFPLYNFFLLRFSPSKIKVNDPSIIFYSSQDFSVPQNIASETSSENKSLIYAAPLISFLSAIKDDKLHVKSFEIQNFKLLIHDDGKADTEFLLKKSFVKVESKNRNSEEALQISSNNIINFNHGKDINVNASCKFNPRNTTLCNLALRNLAIDSLADLNPALKPLQQIRITVNASAGLTIEDNKVRSLTFQAEAKNGSFDLPEFFSKKINFANLLLKGNYNNEIDSLSLSSIEADLQPSGNRNNNEKHLSMSLFVTNLQNMQNKKMDFFIKMQNVPTLEIEGLWPISLPGQDIRNWVISRISYGIIENAFAKFSLVTSNGITDLNDINSQLVFSDLNLNYDEYFPQITGLKGVATFGKNNMEIAISSANVLESKISNAKVSIDDFESKITLLNISGDLTGNASDGLKHANYKSSFAEFIEKYFNGTSSANFAIKVPLLDEISIKDVYISAKERIANLNNEYIAGNLEIKTIKNFNSNNFATKIDLTNAAISAKFFDVEKKSGSAGSLNFSLLVGDNNILFKNLILTKKEEIIENKKSQIVNAKISGNINIDIDSGSLISINLSNQNFGKNDYSFAYDNNPKLQKISLSGKSLDITSFVTNKSPLPKSNEALSGLVFKASLSKITLMNKKALKNFVASINYNDGLFYNSSIKANYSKQQLPIIDLVAVTKPKESISNITGTIADVGYLAEGLHLSDTISGGNAKVKISSQKINGANSFDGEIKIDNEITFYENNATKRLASNDLFSKAKDSIFSNNKTTFNSLKLNFIFAKHNLEISSFIANNYKIGITAKGFVNLADNSYDIKGMIIPGFVINNLFGIGKIPLIGGVISNVLTGGEGGGLFGIKYEYKKLANQKEATFETNKVSAFVPVSIRSLFE